ncbi:PTS lactose transporter subunit IIB [Microbacterium pseudoresistens]|uniref:PTS system cellobiose-specific IIB component n=1 Tax=Microbacterium pseudoresistens TaxID=640634 RepID=A0A7Y9EVS2_9MICO|nr:hypothetical protein [Microbacterium pseudoresistens]NYD54852.1 PTS system cellobiose-specific IIB component [Microbacterium pseudoresistens]
MRIQVVCGAGASSTFVAGRLRRAAESAGREWQVSAAAADAVDGFADVILLGPHLADRRDDIVVHAPRAHLVVLPDDAFSDLDGSRSLALVEQALSKGTS